jgi:hypothetical protein
MMRTFVNCAALVCLSTAALTLVEQRYLSSVVLLVAAICCYLSRAPFPLPGNERRRRHDR